MKIFLLLLFVLVIGLSCHNPFAPPLAEENNSSELFTSSQQTIDGFFETFRAAYTFRDTTIYGKLLDNNFVFSYQNYDAGTEESWGREIEMRTTHGLFMNAQQLELTWNYFRSYQIDSTEASLSRTFRLRVTFSSTDIVQGEGSVRFTLKRKSSADVWRLTHWIDESNF